MLLWKLLLDLVGWWRPKEKPKPGVSAIRKNHLPAHGHFVDEMPMASILTVLISVEEGGAEVELSCGMVVQIVAAKVLRIVDEGKTAVVDFSWRRK